MGSEWSLIQNGAMKHKIVDLLLLQSFGMMNEEFEICNNSSESG